VPDRRRLVALIEQNVVGPLGPEQRAGAVQAAPGP
jgi:hypothetical protein